MLHIEQQIISLDAKYNAHRAPRFPNFRTLYLKRRIQLLRQLRSDFDVNVRRQYLRLRVEILSRKFGAISDGRSASNSRMSGSLATLESITSPLSLGRFSSQTSLCRGDSLSSAGGIVPTWAAEASRAMAGGGTLAESYAFSGMHHIFDVHKEVVTCVKFAHDDQSKLASSSLDGSLALHIILPEPQTLFVLKHPSGVTDFCWSSSNELLMSASTDGYTRLFKSADGQCVRSLPPHTSTPLTSTLHTLHNKLAVTTCIFQPLNNNMIVTGDARGWVLVTNTSTGLAPNKNSSMKATAPISALCFDNTGKILWAGDQNGYIFSFLYHLESGRLGKGKRMCVSAGHSITCISMRQWSSREARDPSLLVNVAANALCLYRIISWDGGLTLKKTFSIKHRRFPIKSSFCPLMSFRQGACIVSGSEDGAVYLLDTERGGSTGASTPGGASCINKLLGHCSPVLGVSFNCDESMLASCDASGVVIIWKRES